MSNIPSNVTRENNKLEYTTKKQEKFVTRIRTKDNPDIEVIIRDFKITMFDIFMKIEEMENLPKKKKESKRKN